MITSITSSSSYNMSAIYSYAFMSILVIDLWSFQIPIFCGVVLLLFAFVLGCLWCLKEPLIFGGTASSHILNPYEWVHHLQILLLCLICLKCPSLSFLICKMRTESISVGLLRGISEIILRKWTMCLFQAWGDWTAQDYTSNHRANLTCN